MPGKKADVHDKTLFRRLENNCAVTWSVFSYAPGFEELDGLKGLKD